MLRSQWVRSSYTWLRNQDLVLLLSMVLVVGGLWAFIELADEVKEGDTRQIDEWLIRSLRTEGAPEDPIGPPWFEEGVRDITALGGMSVLVILSSAVAGFLLIQRQYHALFFLLGALIGGSLLNSALKGFFDRPRPDLVPRLMHVQTASFPSGHALLSAVVYLTLGALLARLVERKRLKVYVLGVAITFSILVGLSRVYLGVHYPSDILAGWTVGSIWAVACWLVARHLQRKGAVEPPGEQ